MRSSHTIALPLLLCLCAGAVHAATINVPADFATIQDAVNSASEGDEIVVAPGTYNENVTWTGTGLTLRGSGGAALTIIDGGGFGAPIRASSVLSGVTVEGFTLTNGGGGDGGGISLVNVADGTIRNCIVRDNANPDASGGGAYLNAGTYLVENTNFINNSISGGGSGGGLYIESATVTINGGSFINNSNPMGSGGGIEVLDESATLTVSNALFTGNSAEDGSGGAIDVVFGATLVVNGSTFTANGIGATSNTFGGAIQAGDGTLVITNSVFTGNADVAVSTGAAGSITSSTFTDNLVAGGSGGGISLTLVDQSFTISNCTFTRNTADGGSGGGIFISGNAGVGTATIVGCAFVDNSTPGGSGAGIEVEDASPLIDRCTFTGGQTEGGGGGAITARGALATPTIVNSLLISDPEGTGAIRSTNGANPSIINCTIISTAPGTNGSGGALLIDGGTATIRNTVIRDDGTNGQLFYPAVPNVSIQFSNIEGGFVGLGNIDADPLFTNPATGDFSLSVGSPSIDGGNSALVPSGITLDLVGNARISGAAVDQGAFERGGLACDSIDFNNDTSLFDPTDIDAFLSVFSEGPCIPETATCNDIDFNNDTSLFDPCDIDSFLLVFSEGPCTPCGL
jgi:hypothetical protein